jgi:hypothetical protein
LGDSQKVDASWAGEAAALFCWMLNHGEPLEETNRADQTRVQGALRILKPEAVEILRCASLRDRAEIEDQCRQFTLIRSLLQEARAGPPASEIVRRANVKKLSDVGVVVTDDAVRRASQVVSRMTLQERARVAGLYFVRHHAALWFLRSSGGYFS